MAKYNAGSVSARIDLDTSDVDKSIRKLIDDVGKLKGELSNSGTSQLSKDVETLKANFNSLSESVSKLTSTNNDYKKQISSLREELKRTGTDSKDRVNEIKQLKQALSEVSNLKITPKGLTDVQNNWHRATLQVKKDASDIAGAMEKFANTNYIPSNQIVDEYKLSLQGLSNIIKGLNEVSRRYSQESNKIITSMSKMAETNENYVVNGFRNQQKALQYVTTGYNKLSDSVVKSTQVLNSFNFKLLEGIDRESIFYQRTVHLASAIQKLSVQGSKNWQGRNVTGGYSTYLSQSSNIQKKAIEQTNKLKIATGQLGQAYEKSGINLNTYKANLSSVNTKLEEQRAKVNRVKQAQEQLAWLQRTDYLSQYKANMTDINQKLEKQTQTTDKLNKSTRTGQMSMREFGTTMGKAEAYSNNMYRSLQKVRSVMVSIKTIAGAMGLMAVWGFASDLIEGVKETYAAKSEMESMLAKNTHVDAMGIQKVNDALDDTSKKFQRINKYSLGETAASIGLEFDLTADQIAKATETIAMVQNEYARAGRSNEEAALAVKDILQGEFRRLSMETGIGEEELTGKYGWSGQKEDVMGLLEALEKAGHARHWDVFASKATSLNDILTITQSRFGELGADLVSNVEPLILSAFNGIMGGIDALKNHFDSLGSFGKITTIGGAGLGIFTTVSTALMMFKRNMGLAEIATLGWGRSFGTALMGLNKTDVALHGFWKTLIATISGTDAASTANVRFGKSLLSRLLGVKANIAGEEGFLKAIMVSQGALRGESEIMTLTAASGLNLSQKLAAVTNNLSATEVQGMKTSTAIRKIVTSTKLLKIALLGITSIAIISVFANIAMEADRAKKAIDNFNNINKNGASIAENAQKKIDKYTTALDGLTKGTKKYGRVSQKLEIAKLNKQDIDNANELLATHKRIYASQKASIKERREERYEDSLKLASDGNKTLSTTSYEAQMQQAIEVRNKALGEYDSRLYKASQHINQQVQLMKDANVPEEKRLKYVREYQAESETTAKLWKKFYEGDLNSGFYAVLSELKLLWIDLWNNQHFVNFWNSVKTTWDNLKPTLNWLKDNLITIGETLLDFFSTKEGQIVGGIAAAGLAFGLIGTKIYHLLGGAKSTIDILKTMGGKLKKVARGWKKVSDNAEEAIEKTGGTTTTDTTSTGGITGGVEKGKFWETVGQDARNTGRTMFKAAGYIAAAMFLVTEAILLIQAPMGALAATGWTFKQLEPNIRQGIEGLKLIAPVMAIFLPPVIAIMLIMDKVKGTVSENIVYTATQSAKVIAAGMLIVAEAIVMLIPSMVAISALGWVNNALGNGLSDGIRAINLIGEAVMAMVPVVPIFVAAIALGAIAIATGGTGLAVAVGGIALGMLGVSAAIVTLAEPMLAIALLGGTFQDTTAIRKGCEAIKVTAEALGYVNDAMTSLTGIDLNLLAQSIADVVASWFGVDLNSKLTDLTKEDGVLTQLNDFVKAFNSEKFNIVPPDPDKVTNLGLAGDGVKTIGDAMSKVKTAMDNLPPEFKNNNATSLTYDPKTNTTSVAGSASVSNYFDTFKEPIRQLKSFISDFNDSEEFAIEPIDTTRVDNLSKAADMIVVVNDAVEKVKTTMQNVGDSGSATAFAEGGWFGQIGYNLFHQTGIGSMNNGQGSGDYKSSLGSQLKEMEDVISDLFTFQSNISQYGGEGGEVGNVNNLANMVSIIQDAISKVATSLSDAVPQFKDKGKSLSSAIVNGFKEGSSSAKGMASTMVNNIANGIMISKETLYNTATSLGKTTAGKFKTGVAPMSDHMANEMKYTNDALNGNWHDTLGTSAYNLGQYVSSQYKNGLDMNSPGLMARTTQEEVGYIGDALNINNLPQMAFGLAQSLSSTFSGAFNLSNIQLPDLSAWTSKIQTVVPTISGIKTQVSTNFNAMKTNVQNSFGSIVSRTQTSLGSMRSATIKNIGNIKSSWKGMQDALIASADHIKTQTSQKINKLKTNLGEFWNKIKHPDQLISGAAGSRPTGTIRRRFSSPKIGYAGSSLFKPRKSRKDPSDYFEEAMKCQIATGTPCYAGWNFNWTNKISDKFNGWNTHFNKFNLDSHLNVGKFKNSNFPIKGYAEVAKDYIKEVIMGTTYDFYFNEKYSTPADALRAGSFNCFDGTRVILALAQAFGFGGGGMGHGTWSGTNHVWASIPGLGIIDPTALQRGYGFKSPKVKGYAGSRPRHSKDGAGDSGKVVHNHGDTIVNINAPVYGVEDLHKAIEDGVNKAKRNLFKNYSGV